MWFLHTTELIGLMRMLKEDNKQKKNYLHHYGGFTLSINGLQKRGEREKEKQFRTLVYNVNAIISAGF